MPSLSHRERANPPPRRKSCVACIKAKRRCDLGRPACLRCAQRQLPCTYPAPVRRGGAGTGPDSRHRHHADPATQPEVPPAVLPTTTAAEARLPFSPMPWMTTGATSAHSSLGVPQLAACSDSTALSPILDIDGSPWRAQVECDLALAQSTTAPAGSHSSSSSSSSSQGSALVPSTSSWSVPTSGLEFIDPKLGGRLQYALDVITRGPQTMVRENQTPWCHPHLYRSYMPRSMQDAYACCALYAAKNPANARTIWPVIQTRAAELAGAPTPSSQLEVLARVQALVLYQAMCLFDGDIRARAAAETTGHAALDAGCNALLAHLRLDHPQYLESPIETLEEVASPAPCYDDPTAPDDVRGFLSLCSSSNSNSSFSSSAVADWRRLWDDWVFQESARRTFLTAILVPQLYRLLKRDLPLQCDPRLCLCNAFTLSAHLWRAGDAVEFAVAWRERKHFVVVDANIADVIREARPDDVDVFGRIFLTTIVGYENAKGWFLARGGAL